MSYEELEAKAQYLEWQNEKLQEQRERLFDRTIELSTENAKLRRLCRYLHSFIGSAPIERWPEIRERMQELGVEVG